MSVFIDGSITSDLATLAYVGPGPAAGALTAILGLLGTVFLALLAVFAAPLRALFRRRKAGKSASGAEAAGEDHGSVGATADADDAPLQQDGDPPGDDGDGESRRRDGA